MSTRFLGQRIGPMEIDVLFGDDAVTPEGLLLESDTGSETAFLLLESDTDGTTVLLLESAE